MQSLMALKCTVEDQINNYPNKFKTENADMLLLALSMPVTISNKPTESGDPSPSFGGLRQKEEEHVENY